MRLAVLGQRKPQRLFGAGLADRAGNANHLGLRTRPGRGCERAQALEHIRHDEQRRVRRQLHRRIRGDDRKRRFSCERGLDELVSVTAVGNGKERIASTDGAAVDRDARNGLRQRTAPLGPHGRRHLLNGPQRGRAHAASSLSAAATAS